MSSLDERQLQEVKQIYDEEQQRIDDAVNAAWVNDEQITAGICADLLQSKFKPIRAQAHLLHARLPRTVDKVQHAKQAQLRLQKLVEEHPDVRDWGAMLAAAVWVLDHPPPWVAMEELDDYNQQGWLDRASQLLSDENPASVNNMNQVEALKIYLTFVQSTYLSIRAQCHYNLACIKFAGDDLFRRLEAFQALEDLQKMHLRNPKDPIWLAMVLKTQQILGGATRRDWEVTAAAAGYGRTMEQLVRTLSRLGQPVAGFTL